MRRVVGTAVLRSVYCVVHVGCRSKVGKWHSVNGVETAPQTPVAQPKAARAGEHWTQTATTMDMGATCAVHRVQGVEERLHRVSLFSATATTLTQHYDLIRQCISAKRDGVTPHCISTTMPAEVWPDASHAHRLRVFDALVEAGHWKLSKRRGKMMKPYVPVIVVKFCLSSVLLAVPSDLLDIPFYQVVRVSAFKDSEETLPNTTNNTTFFEVPGSTRCATSKIFTPRGGVEKYARCGIARRRRSGPTWPRGRS